MQAIAQSGIFTEKLLGLLPGAISIRHGAEEGASSQAGGPVGAHPEECRSRFPHRFVPEQSEAFRLVGDESRQVAGARDPPVNILSAGKMLLKAYPGVQDYEFHGAPPAGSKNTT